MNVTKDGLKDRQFHIEDYLQIVSVEQKEYAEVSAHQRIAENNDIITDFQTDNLMEQMLQKDNLNKVYKKVKSNKGTGGVGGWWIIHTRFVKAIEYGLSTSMRTSMRLPVFLILKRMYISFNSRSS